MILNFFSLSILVAHTLSLNNPSDATLVSLSIWIYLRWRPRRMPILSEKIKLCDTEKCLKPLLFSKIVSYEVGITLKTLSL